MMADGIWLQMVSEQFFISFHFLTATSLPSQHVFFIPILPPVFLILYVPLPCTPPPPPPLDLSISLQNGGPSVLDNSFTHHALFLSWPDVDGELLWKVQNETKSRQRLLCRSILLWSFLTSPPDMNFLEESNVISALKVNWKYSCQLVCMPNGWVHCQIVGGQLFFGNFLLQKREISFCAAQHFVCWAACS